jgi:hypothetical protein
MKKMMKKFQAMGQGKKKGGFGGMGGFKMPF